MWEGSVIRVLAGVWGDLYREDHDDAALVYAADRRGRSERHSPIPFSIEIYVRGVIN